MGVLGGLSETVTFTLKVVNGQAAAADFEKVGTNAEKAGKGLEGAKGKMLAFGAGAAFAGAVAVPMLMDAASSAADLQVAMASTEEIFGKASDAVIKFSETSVDRMGLSQSAYLQAANGLGALLKNLGYDLPTAAAEADRMMQIAADRGAMMGITTEDAAQRINAALRGERDSIEALGISITQSAVEHKVLELGLDTSTEAAKKYAEAQATAALITDQAADSMGFFASDANEAARAQAQLAANIENLKASVGELVSPLLTYASREIGKLAEGARDLQGAVNKAGEKVGDFGKWVVGADEKAGYLVDRLRENSMGFNDLGQSARAVEGALGDVAAATASVGAAKWSGDQLAQIQNLADKWKAAHERMADYYGALLGENDEQVAFESAVDDMIDAVKDQGLTMDVTSEAGRTQIGVIEDMQSAVAGLMTKTLEQTGSYDRAKKAGQGLIDSFIAQAGEAGLTAEQVAAISFQLNSIPASVSSSVYVDAGGATQSLQTMYDLLTYIEGHHTTTVEAYIPGTQTRSVGGKGAGQFGKMGGGGDVYITLSDEAITKAVERGSRRMGGADIRVRNRG